MLMPLTRKLVHGYLVVGSSLVLPDNLLPQSIHFVYDWFAVEAFLPRPGERCLSGDFANRERWGSVESRRAEVACDLFGCLAENQA